MRNCDFPVLVEIADNLVIDAKDVRYLKYRRGAIFENGKEGVEIGLKDVGVSNVFVDQGETQEELFKKLHSRIDTALEEAKEGGCRLPISKIEKGKPSICDEEVIE